jgi:hypothetical protein
MPHDSTVAAIEEMPVSTRSVGYSGSLTETVANVVQQFASDPLALCFWRRHSVNESPHL